MVELLACSPEPESIIIGENVYEANALFYIAQDRGYFANNGINVTMQPYESVTKVFDGLQNKEVDAGLASEFVLSGRLLDKASISIIGSIDRFESLYIIGRKDKGIQNISDLKGKRIGLTRQAIGEFYLGRFLNLNGMSITDVKLVDATPPQQLEAITNGTVDALVAGRNIDIIKERFGDSIVTWSVHNNQPGFILIGGRSDWLAEHPGQINKLLKSLVQAEEYLVNHPSEAMAIVQKRLNYTDAQIASAWLQHRLAVTLDFSLITAMNDEARWMMDNNLTTEKTVPDFKDYIYLDGLRAVKPEAVSITK
jgi:NitT/TauT family transport system substrate-binding protein